MWWPIPTPCWSASSDSIWSSRMVEQECTLSWWPIFSRRVSPFMSAMISRYGSFGSLSIERKDTNAKLFFLGNNPSGLNAGQDSGRKETCGARTKPRDEYDLEGSRFPAPYHSWTKEAQNLCRAVEGRLWCKKHPPLFAHVKRQSCVLIFSWLIWFAPIVSRIDGHYGLQSPLGDQQPEKETRDRTQSPK